MINSVDSDSDRWRYLSLFEKFCLACYGINVQYVEHAIVGADTIKITASTNPDIYYGGININLCTVDQYRLNVARIAAIIRMEKAACTLNRKHNLKARTIRVEDYEIMPDFKKNVSDLISEFNKWEQ